VAHLSYSTVPKIRQDLERVKDAWRNNKTATDLESPAPEMSAIALQLARAYRLIDWDQAIPIAHDLFRNPDNRQEWMTRIQHLLIDEFQDFNRSEQAFISTLASAVTSMVIVGDDNQSIYSGRGGSPQGIRTLFQSGEHDTVTLARCRRSREQILRHLNAFLLWLRPDATAMLPYHAGGQVDCFRFKSSKSELEFLTHFLNAQIAELPAEPRSRDGIVCLFPTRRALDFYFRSLREAVASYVRGPQPFAEREWLSLVLQLVCQPRQRFVERLILETLPEIKPRHKKAIVRMVLERDCSPVDAVAALLADEGLTREAAAEAPHFIDLCTRLSSQDPAAISHPVAAQLNLKPDDVRAGLERFIAETGETDQDEGIAGLCDRLLPHTAMPKEDPHSVLFTTMHGSKGLTKHVVVLPGLEDAWLPGQATGDAAEERARLFYVSLSRATDHVQITYPGNRAKSDPLNLDTPGRGEVCRFVTEGGIPCLYHS
jgi:superfamily I DNA/RNA helicase